MQGLYGPFNLSERVLQKIWLRGDFATQDLRTASGKRLKLRDPGRWNLQGGPDFKEARLELDGQSVVGDVEIHFFESDWWAHGHGDNPRFDRVVLHVVLFEEEPGGRPARTSRGAAPERLQLLPLLGRDLEDYAEDDALLELERLDELAWVARFLERPAGEREALIAEGSKQRWEGKLKFARKRLSGADWSEACHQFCLEVLGYARNRAPMSRIALEWPWARLTGPDSRRPGADALFESQQARWQLGGLRPANQPRRRLEAYLDLLACRPDWPGRLRENLREWCAGRESDCANDAGDAPAFRRRQGLRARAEGLRLELLGGLVGEKRFHTLMVDAFLPLAAADGGAGAAEYWAHWWPGDCPDALRRFCRQAGLAARGRPLTNGTVQGALALFLSGGPKD